MTVTAAVPTTPTEWEEFVQTALSTPEKFKAAYEDGSFIDALKGYQGATNKTMNDIRQQLTEQMQATVLDMAKDAGVRPDRGRPNLADKAVGYSADAPGAKLDAWSSGGQMIHDLLTEPLRRTKEQSARLEKYTEFTAAYSEKIPSEGGYLVPEEVRALVDSLALEQAVVRPKAQVVPLSTGKMKWPVVDFTTEVGEVFGGITMAWMDEGETIPESSATFAAIALNAWKLGGLASLPVELVRDAKAIDAWVRQALPKAQVHVQDLGFMKGDGVAKPLGGLHPDNPALIVVPDETGQSTASITWNNVLAMFARLLPESYDTAEWVIAPNAIPEIFSMALPVGTGGTAVMIGEGGGPGRPAMTMLGMPLRFSRKAPAALGTQGDISLVDWSTYVIGDAQQMTLETSEHSSFRNHKIDFRIISRVDGQPGLLAPLQPEYGGDTMSAYLQLETRTLD